MTYSYAAFQKARRKEQRKFKPTKEQVAVAQRRIIAVFTKFGGGIRAFSQAELIHVLGREVHNRDRQLGDYKKGDFAVTLAHALRAVINSGDIVQTDGWFGLTTPIRQPKPHRQKYHDKVHRRRAA